MRLAVASPTDEIGKGVPVGGGVVVVCDTGKGMDSAGLAIREWIVFGEAGNLNA